MTLHHFSDASEEGYGQVSNLGLVDTENKIHCVSLMGKSRVTPLKFVSIPPLELTVATLSVKMLKLIQKQLQYSIDKEYLWPDSQVVLGYLQNESKRFKVFVASRIQIIKEHSDVGQWQYVASKDNSADHASRRIIGNNPAGKFGPQDVLRTLPALTSPGCPLKILFDCPWDVPI